MVVIPGSPFILMLVAVIWSRTAACSLSRAPVRLLRPGLAEAAAGQGSVTACG